MDTGIICGVSVKNEMANLCSVQEEKPCAQNCHKKEKKQKMIILDQIR